MEKHCKTSWIEVAGHLHSALDSIWPKDSTEVAFFFLELSKLADVASEYVSRYEKRTEA